MSIIGIDFGNKNTCIATAKRAGIDVIANETSNRLTPAMVGFTAKDRMIGEAALSGQRSNVKNTITEVKRLLGCLPDEADVSAEIERHPFKIITGDDGKLKYQVQYQGETATFSTEQAAGAVLTKLRQTAEQNTGTKVADCVISCPGYWPDHRRRALLDAAKIAGLNVLRIMNDTTAAALQYGITKKPDELPEDKEGEDGRLVMFIDSGHSDTSFCVARFVRGKVNILATSYCRAFGGRNVDDVVTGYFADQFKEKYKIDVRSNSKALLRLSAEAEKTKKVLCGIDRTSINIDCLMDDKDVSGEMTRDTLLESLVPSLEVLAEPLESVLVKAGVSASALHSVEVVGGSMYLPALQNFLSEKLGKPLSKTLNQSEAVARGCALQAAMLSPSFRVREFTVHDITPYAVKMTFKPLAQEGSDSMDGVAEESNVVIKAGNAMPSTKKLSFDQRVPFELQCEYDESAYPLLPSGTPTGIASFKVPVLPPVGADTYKSEMDVTLRLNLSGVLSMEKVEITEKYEKEVEEPVPQADVAKGDAPPADAAPADASKADAAPAAEADAAPAAEPAPADAPSADAPAADPAAPMETSEAAAPAAPAPPLMQKVIKKKKRMLDVGFQGNATHGLYGNDMTNAVEGELQMILNDRIVMETAEKRNAIEEYLFDMKRRLYEDLASFVSEADRASFESVLDATDEWLYEDGEDCSKAVYTAKLEELHNIGNPIAARKKESDARSDSIRNLTSQIETWRGLAASTDEKYSHITPDERAQVTARCTEYETWAKESTEAIEKAPLTEDAPVKAADFDLKAKALVSFATPIMNKAKPPPPPPPAAEKPADAPKDDAAMQADDTKEEGNGADTGKEEAATDGPAAENPMDLD